MTRNTKIVALVVVACMMLCAAIYLISSSGSNSIDGDRAAGTAIDEPAVTPSRVEPVSPLGAEPAAPSSPSTGGNIAARKHLISETVQDPLKKIRDSIRFNRDPFSLMASERTDLIDMLNDAQYQAEWPNILRYIAYAGESDLSTFVIIEYATRDEDPTSVSELHRVKQYNLLAGKACAIFGLGLTGGEEANEYLRKSISIEGAKEVTEKWIHLVENHSIDDLDEETVHGLVRGRAAMGLVLTQEPENVKIARDLYTKTTAYLRAEAGPRLAHASRHRSHGPQHRSAETLHGYLADVMATDDLVKEVGIDEYKRISLWPQRHIGLLREYGKKYIFDYWNYE